MAEMIRVFVILIGAFVVLCNLPSTRAQPSTEDIHARSNYLKFTTDDLIQNRYYEAEILDSSNTSNVCCYGALIDANAVAVTFVNKHCFK